jgi:hypothetical protein
MQRARRPPRRPLHWGDAASGGMWHAGYVERTRYRRGDGGLKRGLGQGSWTGQGLWSKEHRGRRWRSSPRSATQKALPLLPGRLLARGPSEYSASSARPPYHGTSHNSKQHVTASSLSRHVHGVSPLAHTTSPTRTGPCSQDSRSIDSLRHGAAHCVTAHCVTAR